MEAAAGFPGRRDDGPCPVGTDEHSGERRGLGASAHHRGDSVAGTGDQVRDERHGVHGVEDRDAGDGGSGIGRGGAAVRVHGPGEGAGPVGGTVVRGAGDLGVLRGSDHADRGGGDSDRRPDRDGGGGGVCVQEVRVVSRGNAAAGAGDHFPGALVRLFRTAAAGPIRKFPGDAGLFRAGGSRGVPDDAGDAGRDRGGAADVPGGVERGERFVRRDQPGVQLRFRASVSVPFL